MKTFFARLKNKKGQGAVEYALITLLVVIILVALLSSGPFNNLVRNLFNKIQTKTANL